MILTLGVIAIVTAVIAEAILLSKKIDADHDKR